MENHKVIDLLRRVRHDFGNHLQVISGYLELGMNEQLREYVAEVVEEVSCQRVIFENLEADAALYMYEQCLQAKDLGINLQFEDIDIKSVEILKARKQPYQSIVLVQEELNLGDEDLRLYLSIYEDEKGVDLLYSCKQLGQNSRRFRINRE